MGDLGLVDRFEAAVVLRERLRRRVAEGTADVHGAVSYRRSVKKQLRLCEAEVDRLRAQLVTG